MKSVNNSFSKVILFDIDYTLFNTQVYRDNMFQSLADKIGNKDAKFLDLAEKAYFSSKQNGAFIPALFLKKLIEVLEIKISPKKLHHVIWKKDSFSKSLYEETIEVLRLLSEDKDIALGIFSAGYKKFQAKKIEAIKDLLYDEHIHIFSEKGSKLEKIFKKYKGLKVYYVDDVLGILKKAKEINKDVTTIWIKRGRLAEKENSKTNFTPDITITNLIELVPIIKGK